jgi:hypothetical protein
LVVPSAGSITATSTFVETYTEPPRGNDGPLKSEDIVFATPQGDLDRTLVTGQGAGLVDFGVIPHLEHVHHPDASLSNAERWAARIPAPTYAIDDQTAIKVTDGTVEVISEGWQFATMQHAAQAHGWTRFVSMQDQYSLIHREEEREMFGLLANQGVGSIPWSPLSGGLVTRPWGERSTQRAEGNRRVDQQDRPIFLDSDQATVDAVQRIALARGVCRWRRSRWPGC